ncbi:MAG: Cytochrome oxidase maturation protein cbb3-type [Alphaproteobacteria bacterium ADurb.BinA280]|jgi:cbb3-type cytochrome oxidase maturation protein|nr:cbb3-type cytochrome oxidase assembly protein CcoS [Xanthomonadales bacterium]MCC6507202.1 cbb3-type cytochrome oxidase assembly protein CcoS [Aquimonas sp.]OPZ12282.1 MAG: Cytochrome oxidase maturation protein cbb3-type [Alphaproteobacteria bacterium ADurb.BinA280]
MSVLIYLVPVSLILLGLAFWAFWWAVKRGQFDNLDTPAIDILTSDERETPLRDPRQAVMPKESSDRAD